MARSLGSMGEEEKKIKLHRTLMWHRVGPFKPSATSSQGHTQQPHQSSTNRTRRGAVLSEPAQPTDKACISFNKGTCPSNTDHPFLLHMCSYCLYTVQHLCHHTEQFCRWKALPKNRAWVV